MSSRLKMAFGIPDRWIPYKACGNVIEGTRIICFKVPLSRIVQAEVVASKDIWDIKALLKAIPKLRAVIDLTNTARYYNPEEFKSAGIAHTKLLMPGRVIPPESIVVQFCNTIDELLKADSDSLVGVHCTHGLNRTGYMVCRYMRDRLEIPANEAIKRFEEARGYKIERGNYIADLLGKTTVPRPDIDCDTIIKPIDNESDSSDEDSNKNESKRRFQNLKRHQSSYDNTNKADAMKRSRRIEKSDSAPEKSSSQYDYKYDY